MTTPFLVKLPVFTLEGGVRALLVTATVLPDGRTAKAVFFRADNRQAEVIMPAARLMHAMKNGPFVSLAEIDGNAERKSSAGLFGPNGQPL